MGSYGALWKARLHLIRPGNVAMAGLGTFVGFMIGVQAKTDATADTWVISGAWFPAALAAGCITAFGNILNDLRDVAIDRTAHPDRPLVTGILSTQQAQAFAALMLAVGVWAAFTAGFFWDSQTSDGLLVAGFALANAGLLWFYEAFAKAKGLPGNILVAALVASTFVFGDVAAAGLPITPPTLLLAALALGANLARELIKDVQDADADQAHRATFGSRHPAAALRGALVLVLMAVAVSYVAWQQRSQPILWGVLLLVADAIMVAGAAMAQKRPEAGQKWLKAGMLVALAAFLVAALA